MKFQLGFLVLCVASTYTSAYFLRGRVNSRSKEVGSGVSDDGNSGGPRGKCQKVVDFCSEKPARSDPELLDVDDDDIKYCKDKVVELMDGNTGDKRDVNGELDQCKAALDLCLDYSEETSEVTRALNLAVRQEALQECGDALQALTDDDDISGGNDGGSGSPSSQNRDLRKLLSRLLRKY